MRKLLLSTAALSLVLGTAGYVQAQSSDDVKMKQEIQKLEQNKKSNAASEQDKAKSSAKSSDKTDKASGQASSSDTSKSSDTAKKDNATPSRASDTSKGSDSAKSVNDSSKPPASQSSQSSESKPSTASDTGKSQPSTASDTSKTQPSTASDTNKSQPSTASDTSKSQPSSTASQNQNAATPSTNTPANTAQSQPAVRVSASLQAGQKTQLTQAFTKVSVKPLSNVNFSVSVGTVIPTSVTLRPVPTTVVTIIPQYRGYEFFVVRDQYVIVEPRTHKIVDVIERSGSASRADATTTKRKLNLSQKDRSYIREHSTTRSTTTTGTASRGETHITVGEDAPEAVEIEQFPADVYRTVPSVRTYRYIHSGDDIYIVEPGSRRVIEQIE
jgi:hypothetical protein